MLQVALFYSVVLSQTRRITSNDLREVAREARSGFVATALSTGNLILRDDAEPAALEQRLEAATAHLLGKPIAVFVRSAAEFRALIAANPFPQETAANPARVGVRVLRRPAAQEAVDRISKICSAEERFASQPRALWIASEHDLSKSPLLTAVSAKWVGPGTMRSVSALWKIAALLPD